MTGPFVYYTPYASKKHKRLNHLQFPWVVKYWSSNKLYHLLRQSAITADQICAAALWRLWRNTASPRLPGWINLTIYPLTLTYVTVTEAGQSSDVSPSSHGAKSWPCQRPNADWCYKSPDDQDSTLKPECFLQFTLVEMSNKVLPDRLISHNILKVLKNLF